MNTETKKQLIQAIAGSLDVPDSAYEDAANRYADIQNWLSDSKKSTVADYSPAISPQGSFRLGTVVRPWKRDDYDLDLTCNLTEGLEKSGITQKSLKAMLGRDLENYRQERRITDPLEEKHRCWRLYYQGDLDFHLDAVPSIPEEEKMRLELRNRMIGFGHDSELADRVTQLAIAITDNRHPRYDSLTTDWLISNPEGYALWFEYQMRQAHDFLAQRVRTERVESLDDLPSYKWRTPLQRCVQILKRHRDIMFEHDQDGKPISIIITTLAAQAYEGEDSVETALPGIIQRMRDYVRESSPRIPNPVNPKEDFADKWGTPEGKAHGLERKFWAWLSQIEADLELVTESSDRAFVSEQASTKFGISLEHETLASILGTTSQQWEPKNHQISTPARPWRNS